MEEYGKGCLLGGACGDAAGATLEFRARVSSEDAEGAMRMPGGGVMHVGRGQITDDTELQLALLSTLLPQGPYNAEDPGDSTGAIKTAQSVTQDGDVLAWTGGNEDPGDVARQCGFLRHGLSLAFYHLRQRTRYADAIKDVLCRAGDTDTNACIVGSLLGALWGARHIPPYMLDPVLSFDCTNVPDDALGHERPATYSARNFLAPFSAERT